MSEWIVSEPILNGDNLNTDNFVYTITGLSASTKYEYRMYFTIEGVKYYGDILSGITSNTPILVATVTTGADYSANTTTLIVQDSEIGSNGGGFITEYGIIYTQSGGLSDQLTYENNNNIVGIFKKSVINSNQLAMPYEFDTTLTGLDSNTSVWYRAFVKNSAGISYGVIRSVLIPAPSIGDGESGSFG